MRRHNFVIFADERLSRRIINTYRIDVDFDENFVTAKGKGEKVDCIKDQAFILYLVSLGMLITIPMQMKILSNQS